MLQEFLGDAVQEAYQKAIVQLDRQSAQAVLDMNKKLKCEVAERVVEIIQRHTVSDKYKDEEVRSDRVYPTTYHVRPVEAQVTELRKLFPGLGSCLEKLSRKPLPAGAEAWFAIPRWQALAPTYNEAVEMMLAVLATKRKFSNRIVGKLGDKYLRQSERSKLAERFWPSSSRATTSWWWRRRRACCIAVRRRGAHAWPWRATSLAWACLPFGCMLLTHPERLSSGETLMIDCSGDEYSVRADYTFDRVPLFDYDLAGIEFSIFYEDRARNLWGTPTGFLYKLV
jgi:hypothetical protein